jgi:hypothetical protein
MLVMMKFFLTAVSVIFIAASCQKQTTINETGEKLSRITIYIPASGETGTSQYGYNNQGQLTEIFSTNDKHAGDTTRQLLTYNGTGQLVSSLVTDNINGGFYRYDFIKDVNGNIAGANCTPLRSGMEVKHVRYVYDGKGRVISDSLYWPATGQLYSWNVIEYDNNDNVTAYQQFVKNGSSIYTQGKFTYTYDDKRSPFSDRLGLFLFTALQGGDGYFYLSKNNPTAAYLNGVATTPGGHFVYEYYNNNLLHTSAVNVTGSQVQEFFYK